jgi:hypothetical protein
MGPATARAYQLIVDQVLTHDGDPHLAWHSVAACKRAGGSRRGAKQETARTSWTAMVTARATRP